MAANALPRVTGEMVIAKTEFLEFKEISYLNKSADERRWDLVSRVGGRQAVMIVPYCGKKIVAIREFLAPLGGYCYSFPSGLLNPGEDAAAAAGRVLVDETGLGIVKILAGSRPVFNSPRLTDEAVTMVYARVKVTAFEKDPVVGGDIETLFLNRERVIALMNDEHCHIDTRAWIEFYHFVNSQ